VSIPDYGSLMRPILEVLSDGRERKPNELRTAMAERFALSDEERAQLLPSGTARVFDNRVAWALTYLQHAGATERVRRAVYGISERGRQLLDEYPDATALFRAIEQFPEIAEFRRGGAEGRRRQTPRARPTAETDIPPLERMAVAQAELDEALAGELLARIRQSDPTFFERLVLKLLVAMGYGGSEEEAAEHLGGGGDEGVDGVINEDKLGLDRIYVQAKRWANNPIRRPEDQAFVGALEGRGAAKGVFITTSRFTDEAKAYVQGLRRPIILIDGHQLAELMIRHDVGVATRRIVAVKEVDEDFFSGDLVV
jgi:restriction system protein